ncbi:MAG: ABC transporter permease subunit [Candidatus Nezhaarchaeota archaeon]|nr:ABC transporter permease subunit [Candidatus Nezhaarchaeota archaeon]
MRPNMFRVIVFSFLTLVLVFFLCVFTSPAIFVEPWQLAHAFLSDEVRFALSLSIFTATCSTLISLVIGIPVAYALSRLEFRGKTVIEGFLDVPIAVPPVTLGVMLLIFFARNPIGMFINERIVTIVFEVPGIIVAQLAVISALTIKLLKETFDGVPARYERVARTFGYTELETFLYITLPAAKRGILGAALISWAKALGEFGATLMLAGATRFKTETLPIALYLNLVAADLGNVAALSFILLFTACLTLIATRKLLYRGLAI